MRSALTRLDGTVEQDATVQRRQCFWPDSMEARAFRRARIRGEARKDGPANLPAVLPLPMHRLSNLILDSAVYGRQILARRFSLA